MRIDAHTSIVRGAIVIPCSWGLSSTFLAPLLGSVALKLLFLCALDFSFTFSFASCICFSFSLFYILQTSKLGEVYFFNLFGCEFVSSLFSILHLSLIYFQFVFYFFCTQKTLKTEEKIENPIEHTDLILLLKHRKSQEGKYLNELLRSLEHFAKDLLAHYDRRCSFCYGEHFDFQCRSHVEHVIASFHTYNYVPLGIKEVEQYVIFKATYELKISLMRFMKLVVCLIIMILRPLIPLFIA
jgi:hypothetical protein